MRMRRRSRLVRIFDDKRAFTTVTGDRGSSLVEYAIVCVISLTMLFGVIDFGRALYAYHFVSNAARTAARWAAVNGSTCGTDGSCTAPVSCSSGSCSTCPSGCTPASQTDVQDYVQMIAPPGINTGSADCGGSACLSTTATWQAPQWTSANPCVSPLNSPGCTVQVQVSYVFNFLVPLVHKGSITMSSTSEMVIAH
jgi:TadE-like protein